MALVPANTMAFSDYSRCCRTAFGSMHKNPDSEAAGTLIDFRSPYLSVGRCRHGLMVWPKNDQIIGRALDLYGEFAEGENQILVKYAKQGDTVIDVGANLGTATLPMSAAVGLSGEVLAFEPQPFICQCLLTNLTLSHCFNVRHFASALGAAPGWATMQVPKQGEPYNYGAVSIGEGGLSVPVLSLDDLNLERCNLIKIDVEGFEWQVMQGARETIRRFSPVLYFEAKRAAGTVYCLQWLIAQGWRCYWHFAFFFHGLNFRGNRQNVFPGVGDINVLALPPGVDPCIELPLIADPEEDWRQVYQLFFTAPGRTLPQ